MTIDIERLRADVEAGTDGPWGVNKGPVFGEYYGFYDPTDWDGCGRLAIFTVSAGPSHAQVNARRIARLPDLEQAYLDLHEQRKGLAVINMQVTAERDILKEQKRELRGALSELLDAMDAVDAEGKRAAKNGGWSSAPVLQMHHKRLAARAALAEGTKE